MGLVIEEVMNELCNQGWVGVLLGRRTRKEVPTMGALVYQSLSECC
jgi:hypothetical protein